MKRLFIVANWKSNKTTDEALHWLKAFKDANVEVPQEKEIIIAASFTLLPAMSLFIKENVLPIKLCAQNISNFAEGAYTGEVNAKQAAEYVTHVIVGHSERRRLLHETDDDILAKLTQAFDYNLTPVLCISDMVQLDHYLSESSFLIDHAEKIIFVYEPPSAISGGGAFKPVGIEEANENAAMMSEKIGKRLITIYGGSVKSDNSKQLFAQEYIHGGLPGQASLDAESFIEIIKNS